MANQQFPEKDIENILSDESVTILSGWTESNTDSPCDEAAYRNKLSANHEGYMKKIQEALVSVSNTPTTTE